MRKSKRGGNNVTNKQTRKVKKINKVEFEYLKLLKILDKAKEDIQRQMEILENAIFEENVILEN